MPNAHQIIKPMTPVYKQVLRLTWKEKISGLRCESNLRPSQLRSSDQSQDLLVYKRHRFDYLMSIRHRELEHLTESHRWQHVIPWGAFRRALMNKPLGTKNTCIQIPSSPPPCSQGLGTFVAQLVEQSHRSCEGCGFDSHLSPENFSFRINFRTSLYRFEYKAPL